MILFRRTAPHPSLCDTLSPRGEEKVSIFSQKTITKEYNIKQFPNTSECNFPLATWGEGVRRTGEGLGL